jgi:hypothetical protein
MVDPGYIAQLKQDLLALSADEVFGQYVTVDACAGYPDLDHEHLRGGSLSTLA